MNQKIQRVKCDLCGNDDFTFLFEGRDYLHFSPLTFKLMKCKVCRLICLNPRPQNMLDYFPESRSNIIIKDHFLFLKPNKIAIIKRLRKKSGRILDIGCGDGEFLFGMSKEGWQVYGNDILKTNCDFAKEKFKLKNIYNQDLLSLDFPKGFFDLVTMWHTLEHMQSPQQVLRRIYQILKDDGILIIESPNYSSLANRLFKEKSYSLDLGRHLYQFSPKTLEKLLNSANFKIYKSDFFVNLRFSFISLKMSMLRYLGIRQIPDREGRSESGTVTNFRKTKMLWELFRWTFDLICLALSFFLILINFDACLRVYCKKIIK